MKIVGMAQIYNERKLGHLKTALDLSLIHI